jgi:tetratricopeptide (TPR) repeat protein
MLRRFLLVGALALACKEAPRATRPPGDASESEAARVDRELAELARRLDPGPQAPLHPGFPRWFIEPIEASLGPELVAAPAGPAAVAAAVAGIARTWDARHSGATVDTWSAALEFGRGLVLAERALAAGSADPELLAALVTAYHLVRHLGLFKGTGLFGQALQAHVEQARASGALDEGQLAEAVAAIRAAAAAAPALQLHATARLLREHPRHATIPDVLMRTADFQHMRQDHAAAVRLLELRVARAGARATASEHADLATACYVALELECGDAASERTAERDPARAASLARTAEKARRAVSLAQATDIAGQIERGHLLLWLKRYLDAEQTFTVARDRHPNDARPHTGLAALAIGRDLDMATAADHILAASGMQHQDQLYFEIGLGTVGVLVLREWMAARGERSADRERRLAAVQAMVAHYAEFDPARAAVIALLISWVAPAPAAAKPDFEREALELVMTFLNSPDAWRLLYMAVRTSEDAHAAAGIVTTPLPPKLAKDADLRLQQVRAMVDVALAWEDRAVLAAAAQSAATLPAKLDADVVATIRATIDALQGRLGDAAALQRALASFTALAARKTGRERALLLNNAAMIQAQLGEQSAALATLEQAIAAAPEAPAIYNRGALQAATKPEPDAAAVFKAAASAGPSVELRLHAQAWLVTLAEAGDGDPKATRQEFAAALASERREGPLPGGWGVSPQREERLMMSYLYPDGLEIIDEVIPRWWLFAPAPKFAALAAQAERGRGKRKTSR